MPFSRRGAEPSSSEVLSLVTAGIKHNYDQFSTATATIDVVVRDKTPSGVASTKWNQSITFEGDNLRFEILAADASADEVMVFKKGVWQRYAVKKGRLEIAPSGDLLDKPPIDPRDYGASTIKEGLVQQLLNSSVSEARLISRPDGTTVASVIVKRIAGKNTLERKYDFNSKVNFLPTSVTEMLNGNITMRLTIEYQEILAGKAKFPKEATYKWFSPAKRVTSPTDDRWHQAMINTITSVVANESVDKSLWNDIKVPVGTVIEDRVANRLYDKGDTAESRESSARAWTTAIASILLVVCVACFFWRRYRRRSV